jgi:DNA-binding NarL/FixJ family response regulator
MYSIALADHQALRRELLTFFFINERLLDIKVVLEASNLQDLLFQVSALKKRTELPHLLLLDMQLPGQESKYTVSYLKDQYPSMRIIGLSTFINRSLVIDTLRRGINGLITRGGGITELVSALEHVRNDSFYVESFEVARNSFSSPEDLSEKQRVFLQLCISELSYKQIADKMFLSPKTVDHYRDNLFHLFSVNTRTTLVLKAIELGLVAL